MRPRRAASLILAASMVLVTACGSDEAGSPAGPDQSPTSASSSTSAAGSAAVPTAEELAAALVRPDDLEGAWTTWEGPDASASGVPGVVPEEQRGNLPRLDLCDKADAASAQAAKELRWQAFRQLNLTLTDDARMHQVFVQQFLLADDAGRVAATYDAVTDGLRACFGTQQTYDKGVTGISRRMALPALGDAALGARSIVLEASPRGPATWDLRNVLVRRGSVLMNVQIGEVGFFDDVEPVVDRALAERLLVTIASTMP
ncbi:MAG: hypothetical protein ACTHKG_06970 [Nocardioides sp.]